MGVFIVGPRSVVVKAFGWPTDLDGRATAMWGRAATLDGRVAVHPIAFGLQCLGSFLHGGWWLHLVFLRRPLDENVLLSWPLDNLHLD